MVHMEALRHIISSSMLQRAIFSVRRLPAGARAAATAATQEATSKPDAASIRPIAAPSTSAAAALAQLKRRTKIPDNFSRVSTKHVNRVLELVETDAEAPLALQAVTIARGHAQMTRQTGDLLVKALVEVSEDQGAALEKAIDAVRHPHSSLTLSSRAAGTLLLAAGKASNADSLKRVLALVKERGIKPSQELIIPAIRSSFTCKQPRQALKLYLWRVNFRGGLADDRTLHVLAKMLLAWTDTAAPFFDKKTGDFSEDGKAVLAHVKTTISGGAAGTKGAKVSAATIALAQQLLGKVEASPKPAPAASTTDTLAEGNKSDKSGAVTEKPKVA